jgi:hypothetical protein
MVNISFFYFYAKCGYAKCHIFYSYSDYSYAKSRYAECHHDEGWVFNYKLDYFVTIYILDDLN